MILDKLFQVMADRQASDIFICAGAPIHIKIQGNTVPVNQQVMDSDDDREDRRRTDDSGAGQDLRSDEGDEPLLRRPKLGNFRINLFRQRGSISIVDPLHPRQHPGARFAAAAAGAGRPGHGKTRPDPDRRLDRLGQIDHHRVDARSPERAVAAATSSPSRIRSNICSSTRSRWSTSARSAWTPWAGTTR
jgi:hypothetical protein